jgi:hypothetical protein
MFGVPQVIACSPLRDGKPFPTTFWLTCPHLVRLCGVLESEGAVTELERTRLEQPVPWTEYNLFHAGSACSWCARLRPLPPETPRWRMEHPEPWRYGRN